MKYSSRSSALPAITLILALLFALVPRTTYTHDDLQDGKKAYPNPFKQGESVFFQLTVPRPTKIKIDVYNIRGQHIRNLLGGESGELHDAVENEDIEWDGKDSYGAYVPAGIYIGVLVSEGISVKSVKVVKVDK
ncbi:MAG: T9SS type A sorting domain-containing protein [Candidatus Kapaibacterium sp.]